ncbi:MAG: phenylacetate--CoA ligase family protein [Desulfobacterales bacterium]
MKKMKEQKYWDMDIEPYLNTEKMHQIQSARLQPMLNFHYRFVPFDRKRMQRAGIEPEGILSFNDLAKALPPVGQAEYRQVYEEKMLDMDAIFEELYGPKRLENLYMVNSTSGTTGIPTPYPLFRVEDPDRIPNINGRMSWRANIRPGDRIAILFGLSMHAASTPQILGYQKFPGITLYPIGAEAGTERILNYIKWFKINVFSGTPSLALHLIERSPDVLKEPVRALNMKVLFCGAEPGAGIPEVKSRLENEYGAKVYDAGAGYGISCDHPVYQGMHWVADDYCYYELIDPETKDPIPLTHGATGVAVFTSLYPESPGFFPNIRFTLNDIHQVFTEPCPCGLSGFRYKIVGRADDMLKVKGVPVYPAAIEGVIQSFFPRLTGSFRIVLEEPPPRVVPPLKLKVEYGESIQESDRVELEKEIIEKMHQTLKLRPTITWLKPYTLERATKKTQLLEKLY